MASGDNADAIEVVETSRNTRANQPVNDLESDDEDKEKSSQADKTALDMSSSISGAGGPTGGPTASRSGGSTRATDKERKIGHRRVGVGGEITYKKIQTTQIMGSIQLGIQHAVGGLASKPERDLLMQDFMTVETTNFPSEGSNHTPAHHYSEFRFRTYAPIAFRYFRDLFGIQPDDFLMSMCSSPLRELSNPGASGSIFYLTEDDEFIIKTVQHKEGEFLQKLLPGYYMNLNQNPRTLLPKFFGLFCYQCNSKNVRLVAMNNLLPSAVKLHQKYDLKGSTYKRKASKSERSKSSPTYKDLDFMDHHPDGIFLEADTYQALVKTIQRDCRVLESFKIMDYSLLLGIHNLDQAQKDKLERRSQPIFTSDVESAPSTPLPDGDANSAFLHQERAYERDDRIGANQILEKFRDRERDERITAMANMFQQRAGKENGAGAGETTTAVSTNLNRSRSINKQRLVAHSTAMESIQAESEPIDEEEDVPPGGIPARNARGERLLLFIGIIDILQSYRLKKKLEHTWKSMIHDGDTVSVHRPGFYAQRFMDFMAKTVFKKIPSLDLPEIKGNHRKFRTLVTSYIALKHSPSKRKSLSRPLRQEADFENSAQASCSTHHTNGSKIESPTEHGLTPSSINVTTANGTGSAPIVSPPASHAPPTYPAVLKGRPTIISPPGESGLIKSRVPPPVPPRGSPKIKRGGGGSSASSSKGGFAPSPSCSTPPPAFEDVLRQPDRLMRSGTSTGGSATMTRSSAGSSSGGSSSTGRQRVASAHHVSQTIVKSSTYREETVSITDIRLESRAENKSSLSVESGSSGRGGSGARGAWTPPHSVEGSTPTWTEGTPSFTESSSSGDIGCPTTPVRTGHVSRAGSVAATTTQVTSHSGGHSSTGSGTQHHDEDPAVAAKQQVEHIAMCLASEMTHL